MIPNNELTPIERKENVTIYGKVINSKGKLGQFEVHSTFLGSGGRVFTDYSEAQDRMNALIGVKRTNLTNEPKNKR